jgi:hypothetical protein
MEARRVVRRLFTLQGYMTKRVVTVDRGWDFKRKNN